MNTAKHVGGGQLSRKAVGVQCQSFIPVQRWGRNAHRWSLHLWCEWLSSSGAKKVSEFLHFTSLKFPPLFCSILAWTFLLVFHGFYEVSTSLKCLLSYFFFLTIKSTEIESTILTTWCLEWKWGNKGLVHTHMT